MARLRRRATGLLLGCAVVTAACGSTAPPPAEPQPGTPAASRPAQNAEMPVAWDPEIVLQPGETGRLYTIEPENGSRPYRFGWRADWSAETQPETGRSSHHRLVRGG